MQSESAGSTSRLATLLLLLFVGLSANKAQAFSGCVNQYDEVDPNGDCLTSACTTSCSSGSGGHVIIESRLWHRPMSEARGYQHSSAEPQLVFAADLCTIRSTPQPNNVGLKGIRGGENLSPTFRIITQERLAERRSL
jgi:hypothetical protein